MKTYESYKSIALPWLCKIPSHWNFLRNKNFMSESKNVVGEEWMTHTLLSLTLSGIIPRDVSSGKGKFPKDFNTYKIVQSGDIVLCLFDIDETPCTVGLSNINGMITGAYNVFHIANINPRFLQYYYLCLDNTKALKPLYTGLRKTIKTSIFLGTKMPVPPREEQDQIVRYLDWQVSKINKLIAAKKKQIISLTAKKQIMASDVITHGLNPKAEMKFSGVKWLGDIPAHWTVIKLRGILSAVSEKGHPEMQLLSVVREQGVIVRNLEDSESNHNFIPDDLSGYIVVRKNQFAMNKMKAWQGSYGISQFDGIVSPAYFVFNVNFKNLEYFHYAIRSKVYVNFFAQASDGIRVGQWDLSMNKMKDIPFILPPEDEQAEIVKYIPAQIEIIEKAISTIQSQSDKLHELRTRLISDVVTGQIDVRGIEVPDFEMVEDSEDATDESAESSEVTDK